MEEMDDDVGVDFVFNMNIDDVQVIELGAVDGSDSEVDDDVSRENMQTNSYTVRAVPVKLKTTVVQPKLQGDDGLEANSITEFYRGNFAECEFCKVSFRLKRELRQHIKEFHPEVRFRCNICDKEFKYEDSMYRHRVNVHPVKEVVVESNVEVRSSSHTEVQETTIIEADVVHLEDSDITDVYIFECSYCNAQFSLQAELEDHLAEHSHETENDPHQDIDEPESLRLKSEQELGEDGEPAIQYVCDQCELCFLTSEDLARHKAGHKQKQVFECGDCGKRFATERKVTRHLAVHQQFFCPMCNKMFKYNHVMRRHIRMCHSTESDTLYLCSGCDKTFGCPEQMKRHQLVHNSEEEKKFPCDMCPMRFNYSHTLKRHKMGVHNLLPAEKMISCEFCGKVFKSKDMLKRHYRSHTNERPHICPHCSRAFQFAFVLRRHIMAAHPMAVLDEAADSVLSVDPETEVSIETEI